jgi:hypothetical protein
MGKTRAFLQRRKTRRLIDHQEGAGVTYVLHERAWADAWPHLNDWFKTEAFFIGRGRDRPGIA